MQKGDKIYSGKAKSVYGTEDPDYMVLEFRNDTSAFDGEKVAQLERKGMVNNYFNAWIMQLLADQGVPTHFVKRLSDTESLVKRLEMIPLECVVRNVAAGSLTRRLGIREGTELTPPTFELFLKSDELHDPMVNEFHVRSFGWAEPEHLKAMTDLTFRVNEVLKRTFAESGMILVDYKLEFGLFQGQVTLGDEISPDGCRIWDSQTREKLDKDRFRQDLGNVIESYELVGRRLGIDFGG